MGIENRGLGTTTRAGKTRFLSLCRVEDWSKEPATRLEYLELAAAPLRRRLIIWKKEAVVLKV